MRPHQYVYFALKSEQVSAAEMTTRLGFEPDEVVTRGSRTSDPVVPVCHIWRVVCRKPHMTVDEQIDDVPDRLLPVADRIRELVATPDGDDKPIFSVFQVVRVFECSDSPDDSIAPIDQMAPQERNLLGWHLGATVLDFLRHTHAELDVDEYGS